MFIKNQKWQVYITNKTVSDDQHKIRHGKTFGLLNMGHIRLKTHQAELVERDTRAQLDRKAIPLVAQVKPDQQV